MKRPISLLVFVVLVGALVAGPALGEIFTITLKNGTVFESRYRPAEADWDTSKLIFLTDWGNWMAIPKTDVESILSEIEGRGFGTVINTTTIAFGWDPGLSEEDTDAMLNEEDAEKNPQQAQTDAMAKAFQDLSTSIEESRQVPDYSLEQFVEPDETGGQPIPGAWGNTGPAGDDLGGDEEY